MVIQFFFSCCVASTQWWLHLATNFDKVCDFVAKVQLVEFFAIFFLRFFQLSHDLCEGGYSMRFSPRAGDATISKKLHHHRKQKIARVTTALGKMNHK